MKAEIFNEWVARLESGEIPQVTGTLCDGEARCCLGVLYDVLGFETVTFPDGAQGYYDEGEQTAMPSVATSEAMGLEVEVEDILYGGTMRKVGMLSALNDAGRSFQEIAAWIKENVEVEDEA